MTSDAVLRPALHSTRIEQQIDSVDHLAAVLERVQDPSNDIGTPRGSSCVDVYMLCVFL